MKRCWLLGPCLWLALAGTALAEPTATSATELPAWSLNDSTGAERTLDDAVKRIYATADRDSDALLQAAMEGLDQTTLDRQQAIVLADIHAAPWFIRRVIRKRLAERSYLSWLDEDGRSKAYIAHEPGHVSVIDLERRRILSVHHINDPEALQQLLSPTP